MSWKCLVITPFGWLNCNYVYALLLWGLLLVSPSRYSGKLHRMLNLSASTFKSALQSCLRIHLDCVCVNSTSGGGRSLATPAYQGRLTLVSLPLGAAVNKIKSATLTLPSAQGRPLVRLHPTFPRNCCSIDIRSRAKLQSSSSSLMIAGPAGPCAGRSKPLSFANSKSIG